MQEMNEIISTLENADNEATEAPYWLILDPSQNMRCDFGEMANGIVGPFFCRIDAEAHLKARHYAFSSRAVVFCCSGHWSTKYRALCKALAQKKKEPACIA